MFSEAKRSGVKKLRIIHGRGFSSDNGPVLKLHVRSRLENRYASRIKRIREAPPGQGGSGVTLAVLN